jgi:uncharacterized repeat protein (TIGR03803 family)
MIEPNHSGNLAVRRRTCCFHVPFLLPVLIAILSSALPSRGTAQTVTTLHSFSTASSTNSLGVMTNSDGISPTSLILSGKTLYGTTYEGGGSGSGTVFKLNTDGRGFTTLHGFAALDTSTNVDGANPGAGLILSSNTLYGTSYRGGNSGNGTLFKVNLDGTEFRNLHDFTLLMSFTNSDGANPQAGLVSSGTTLYGTASGGGSSGGGTVFAVNTDGTDFRTIYSFSAVHTNGFNSDGPRPNSLLLSGNTLFGTTSNGTVFAVNTDGTSFTNLPFTANTALVLSGNSLYGCSDAIIFTVHTDGTGFTNLYNLNSFIPPPLPFGAIFLGSWAWGLFFSGDTIYGNLSYSFEVPYGLPPRFTSFFGITSFAVNINGAGFTPQLPESSSGWGGFSAVSGNTFYGIYGTSSSTSNGSIFSESVPPQVTIAPSAANVILSWPTNYAGLDYTGYTLQSTTNLASLVWVTNLPAPVVVNGRNTVTNPISGTQQFFRLSQ